MNPELIQYVVLGAAALGAVAALVAFVGGHLYDAVGKGFLDVPDRPQGPAAPAFDSWHGEAAAETRQLIEARSALRRRHGKRTLEADAEIRAILKRLER